MSVGACVGVCVSECVSAHGQLCPLSLCPVDSILLPVDPLVNMILARSSPFKAGYTRGGTGSVAASSSSSSFSVCNSSSAEVVMEVGSAGGTVTARVWKEYVAQSGRLVLLSGTNCD